LDPVIESQENYLYTEEDEVTPSSNVVKKRAAKKPAASLAAGGDQAEVSAAKDESSNVAKKRAAKKPAASLAAGGDQAEVSAAKDESSNGVKKRAAKKPAASLAAGGGPGKTETSAGVVQTSYEIPEVGDNKEPAGANGSRKRSDVATISRDDGQDVSVGDVLQPNSSSPEDDELVADQKSLSDGKASNTYQYDLEFIASQKEALLVERSTYLEQANSLREEAESLINEAEPGDVQFDEESGEGGTATVDRERDLALSAQALNAVEEINYALRKIEIGKYGVCEGCGQLIVKDRLEALPYARLCVACKSGGLSRR